MAKVLYRLTNIAIGQVIRAGRTGGDGRGAGGGLPFIGPRFRDRGGMDLGIRGDDAIRAGTMASLEKPNRAHDNHDDADDSHD